MAQTPLDREKIVQQAFALLNELGPENLTLRRLAEKLGVQAPAIYWHFKNKQDLLDEMGTEVMRQTAMEGPAAESFADWHSWARAYALRLRGVLLRYREGARMFSGTHLTDVSLYAAMEASLRKLTDAGFSLTEAVTGMGILYSYTIGFVIEEQAAHPMPGEADLHYDLEWRSQRVDGERYPLALAAGKLMFTDHDARFEAGLTIILRGMTAEASSAQAASTV